MKKLKVIIADNDKDYCQRLFSALERKYSNLDLTLADSDVFGKLVQKRVYDIALIDASVYSDDINLKNVKLPLALLDEDIDESIKLANKFGKYVLKYQHIETMYKKMIGYYSELGKDSLLDSGDGCSQMICCYSPAGGVGKTVISCAIAETIANRGNKVLYLNFEDVASYGLLFGAEAGKGLDEIIYQLDKGINMPMKIRSLVKKSRSGVMYFDMFTNIMDVTEITNEKMSVLLDVIMTSGVCEYIVIDLDMALRGINSVIMDKADKILFIETPDTVCREKMKRLYSCRSMFEEYFSKGAVVQNKAAGASFESATDLEIVSTVPKINSDSAENVIGEIVKKGKLDIGRILS